MKRLVWALLVLVSIASAQAPQTASVYVRWNAVTQCTQGGNIIPCPSAATYNVYVGTNGPGSEGKPAIVQGAPGGAPAVITNYVVGATIYIEVTAVVGGIESPMSTEIKYVVAAPTTTPSSPGGVTVGPN